MAEPRNAADARPTERYGDSRRGSRWPAVAVVAVAVAMLLALTGWLIFRGSQDPVDAALLSWDEPADGVLPTTVEIIRDPGLAVSCELVAVDIRQIVVGQITLEVPAGPQRRVVVTTEIPLEGDGIVPELKGCHPAA